MVPHNQNDSPEGDYIEKLDMLIEQASKMKKYASQLSLPSRNKEVNRHLQDALGKLDQAHSLIGDPSAPPPQDTAAPLSSTCSPSPNSSLFEGLEFLLKESPVILYKTSHTYPYRLTYISECVERIMGYSANELLSRPDHWPEHLHPNDAQATIEALLTLIKKGGGEFEYRFLFADGTYHWLLEKFRVTYNEEGDVNGLVGCLLDITEKKEG